MVFLIYYTRDIKIFLKACFARMVQGILRLSVFVKLEVCADEHPPIPPVAG